MGVDRYYRETGSAYFNPQEEGIQKAMVFLLEKQIFRLTRICDLAAGSGEVTRCIERWVKRLPLPRFSNEQRQSLGLLADHSVASRPKYEDIYICATDPYTKEAYERMNPGHKCWPFSFQDVVDGKLEEAIDGKPLDVVIASYALHLVTDNGQLFDLLTALAQTAHYLVVLSPHKKPVIKDNWAGWQAIRLNTLFEQVIDRTHVRVFRSTYLDCVVSAHG